MSKTKLDRGEKINATVDADVILRMLLDEVAAEIQEHGDTDDKRQMYKCHALLRFLNENYDDLIDEIKIITEKCNHDSSLFVDAAALIFSVFTVFKANAYRSFVSFVFDQGADEFNDC